MAQRSISEASVRLAPPTDGRRRPVASLAPLKAAEDDHDRLVPRDLAWRIHDRTHLELTLGYRVPAEGDKRHFEWEAYFFVPDSFRLDSNTYRKDDIYSDLQSYVRLAAPELSLEQVHDKPLRRARQALIDGDEARAVRELRLFACRLRSTTLRAREEVAWLLEHDSSAAQVRVEALMSEARRLCAGLRATLARAPEQASERMIAAMRWVDEDVSLVLESFFGMLQQSVAAAGLPEALSARLTDAAVAEARHREAAGLDAVGRSNMDSREVEHIEFRRHAVKRFTSSVLWLSTERYDPGRWAKEALYALAASVAMGFAVAAALWNGMPAQPSQLAMWMLVAVVAYAIKDRLKATLQSLFSGVVSRHFPDRRWIIRDRERGLELGRVDEQSGFVQPEHVDAEVMAVRRKTWSHQIEEMARPETVLWHRKAVEVRAGAMQQNDERFDGLVEIFRLDVGRWLVNTDDPKNRLVFADPDTRTVRSVNAPRVYNVGIVFRLRSDDGDDSWHRVRVVVSRKGIRRIDPIC